MDIVGIDLGKRSCRLAGMENPFSQSYAVSNITFFHQPHPTTLDAFICT
jgi:hypothetical protein